MELVLDQWVSESLDALAIRIGLLAPHDRVRAGVRLYDPRFASHSPPISAETVLAIAIMKQTGLI